MPRATEPVRCTNCGYIGPHKVRGEITDGQWVCLIVLFIFNLATGFVYAIYLAATGGFRRYRVCPRCRARGKWVPLDYPDPPNDSATATLQ